MVITSSLSNLNWNWTVSRSVGSPPSCSELTQPTVSQVGLGVDGSLPIGSLSTSVVVPSSPGFVSI